MTGPKAQTDKTLNTIRGKNLVAKTTKEEVLKLFEHIDALEMLLDEADQDLGLKAGDIAIARHFDR